MKIVSISFFLILTLQFATANSYSPHPFYVSIIQMDHNLNTNSLEITFKIFTDDLEKSIVKESNVNLHLATTKEFKKADTLIFNYLQEHFRIILDSKTEKYVFIGFEAAFDVTRIYVEVPEISADLKKIRIESDLLIDEIPDQSNVFHYQKEGEIESLILNRSKSEGEILIK